jgi:hypothetical protein
LELAAEVYGVAQLVVYLPIEVGRTSHIAGHHDYARDLLDTAAQVYNLAPQPVYLLLCRVISSSISHLQWAG